jgi:uncharacterized protein DUF5979/prealbumin domain-containing protein
MSKMIRSSFRILNLLVIVVMTFTAPVGVLAAPSPTGATIASDLPDYNPGATVTLTGAGWTGGESVDITVNDDAGQTWSLNSDPDPVTNDSGAFTYQFQLPNWFVANYSVTATGLTSGTATTSFTDLSIGTYDQCSNDDGDGYAGGDTGCRWINGNLQRNNSVYFEGDATVQRLWLTGFVPGTTHTVTLKYGTTKGGKHAYDFLTTWDWSEDWIDLTDRCQDITGCTTAAETYKDIPQDPNVPNSFEPSAPGDRQFVMRGGTLNSATTPTIVSGSYSGDSETAITVNFTVASSGAMCPTTGADRGTCGVALWFGAHVSAQANWGLGMGAGSISGSPYHVALDAVDNASVGQRDNQMQADVVTFFPNGTIIIVKDAQPDDSQDFSFNLSSSTISQNFSLDDDNDPTLPNTTSPNYSVPPGTYTVQELNIPSGWTLAGLTCTVSGTSGSSFTTDIATGTANITLVSVANTTTGDTVTCTYVDNRNTGSLKLTKSLTGGPQDYTGPFTINYDCDGTAYDGSVQVNAGSSQTVSGIPSGTSCTISETLPNPPAGYSFGTPSFSPSATVTISSGTTVEVTTNNTLTLDTGSLKLTKSLSGGPQDYTGPFTINYSCTDGTNGSVQVNAGSSQTVSNIATGASCTISETLPTPPAGYSFGTPAFSPSATVTIGNGTTVEVTTNNSLTRDLGSLVLAKSLTGGPAGYTGPFTINYDCGAGYTGSVSVAAGSSQTVSGVPTDTTCTVSETLPNPPPTGYSFGIPTFSPSDTVIIPAGNGSSVTVTTNNSLTRDTGSLKVNKTLDDDGSGFSDNFSINYDCGGDLSGTLTVPPGGSSTVSGIPTGSSCTVTEPSLPTPPTGYSWSTPVITGSPAAITTSGATVEVTVANSLTRDLGSLVLAKSLTGGPAGYTGPFTINYTCTDGTSGSKSVNAGSSETVSGIPTGTTCTVSETLPTPPTGYSFGTPTFSPADTVTIPVGNGSSVTITTNNSLTRDTGSFKITKTTSNPDAATLPAFTGTYNCGTGYTGTWSVADGGSQTVTGIPTGNTCSVTEDALSPISGYTWGTPTFNPASIVISTKDQTFEIVVGNSINRDRGSLKITKQTSNPDGVTLPASFTGTYDCGGGYSGSFSVADGASQTFGGIPTGSVCTVTETMPTPIPGYTWGTITYTPSSITISTTGGTFEIVVGNSITRDRGSLKIYKTLSNPDGASVQSSFTVNYNCGAGYTGQVSVASGSPATVNGIPTGSTCTVTEVAPTPIPNYTWGTITYTPASVTIDTKDQTFSITIGNSITRDRGSLTIVKKVINDNGGTATVSAFGLNTTAGTLTFDSGAASGTTTTYTSQKLTVVTGNYTLRENDIYGYTEGSWSCTYGTANPTTYNNGSVYVAKDKDVVCTITNDDQPGTIVVIKNAKPAEGSFSFTTTGTGYNGFTLTGATTGNGNVNSQTLNVGTYTVKEGTQLSWILTGIGGSTDINTPYNCVVTGSGGSTGVGDLTTQTATINLKNGDTVTCTFENTGNGATRTQGFWATHPELAQIAWFGGTAYGHTFPGVAAVTGIGDRSICGRALEGPGVKDISKLMGGFWSDISKTSTGAKRSALDQARMQLLQQLLAAELNASAFGSIPSGGSGMFAQWETALCGTNQNNLNTAKQQAASFNSQGDNSTFTPGTSANSKYARLIANIPFWDIIKP